MVYSVMGDTTSDIGPFPEPLVFVVTVAAHVAVTIVVC